MNWRLIFGLSLFGLAMALATVSLIPSNIEPIVWLTIFVVCAFIIARRRTTLYFAHGLLVGIVNSVWVTAAHVLFFSAYLANHPREAAMARSMPLSNSPRLLMTITGPVIGVISGVIIGALAWVAARLVSPAAPAAARDE